MTEQTAPKAVHKEQVTNIGALLGELTRRPDASEALIRASAELGELLAPADKTGPFLTVLVRTQGQRPEPLRDALLCLAGQTCQDFEVLVLIHTEDADAVADVHRIVSRLEPSFASRVRALHIEGGSRATPLNVGVKEARGRRIAVFDDDDLLMGHWVEAFAEAEDEARGRLIRALSANQWVKPEQWQGDLAGMRALSWPAVEFPDTFDHVDHLQINRSPFMTWAFPRELFHVVGLRFDEELAVCEDWDVILQGSAWFGVYGATELTSIYRRWKRGDSSYLVHARQEWLGSEERVRDRLDAAPLLLPPGSARRVAQLRGRVDIVAIYGPLFRGDRLRQPLNFLWLVAQPGIRFAVRLRAVMRRVVAMARLAVLRARRRRRLHSSRSV